MKILNNQKQRETPKKFLIRANTNFQILKIIIRRKTLKNAKKNANIKY